MSLNETGLGQLCSNQVFTVKMIQHTPECKTQQESDYEEIWETSEAQRKMVE